MAWSDEARRAALAARRAKSKKGTAARLGLRRSGAGKRGMDRFAAEMMRQPGARSTPGAASRGWGNAMRVKPRSKKIPLATPKPKVAGGHRGNVGAGNWYNARAKAAQAAKGKVAGRLQPRKKRR